MILKERFEIRMDNQLKADLQALAGQEGRKLAALIRHVLAAYVAGQSPPVDQTLVSDPQPIEESLCVLPS